MIPQPNSKIVLCIPGPWRDRDAMSGAVAKGGRYLAAGPILMDLQSQNVFGLEMSMQDARMANAFVAAAPNFAKTPLLKSIARHRSVLYLTTEIRTLAGARTLMDAAAAILDAGGLAVKVESAGLAHAPEEWRACCEDGGAAGAHRAFVVFVQAQRSYSCGMHNFGLRDAMIEVQTDANAIELLRIFTWYLLTETPSIEAGQTFATSSSGPSYEILQDANTRFAPDDLFYNAFGTWRLQRF